MSSCIDLIELFQLPTPLTSEVDKKRRNPHLAFPSLNKCNVVRATAAAIARGKRNLGGPSISVFYGNSGTKFSACHPDCAPEFLPKAMGETVLREVCRIINMMVGLH